MQKNEKYWEKRALQRAGQAEQKGAALTEKLFKAYEKAAEEIRKEIADFYVRYAGKHGLTYEQAARVLNRKESGEWKKALEDYLEEINTEADPAVKAKLTAQLDALSYNSRITRLEALLGQIDLKLGELYSEGVREMKEAFGDTFREGYYHKIFDIQSRAGFIAGFAQIDEDRVENILSYPWSGASFSDRLWQNKQALLYHMRKTLTQGAIRGKSISEMSKELSDRMGQSYKTAERLVRTENAYFHGEADKAAYQAAGVEAYLYLATLDVRACAVCGAMDRKHFPLSEAKAGVNYPPLHPNCRCTTVEYDPDDELDWYNSGAPMPEHMTYEKWYQKMVEGNGEGYVERERKKAYNRTRDQEQYDNLVKFFGKNAPESFQDFQELKYDRPDEYQQFRAYARSIRSGELSAMADFSLYRETSLRIDQKIIGMTTSKGTKIVSKSDHFINRVIGSVEEQRSGVTIESIQEALATPDRVDERQGKRGVSVRYFGKDAIVTVNPDTGNLIQVNPRHSQGGK